MEVLSLLEDFALYVRYDLSLRSQKVAPSCLIAQTHLMVDLPDCLTGSQVFQSRSE